MADKNLRIGIIGAGWAAVTGHIPALRATGRAEVVAISRRDKALLTHVQQMFGIAETYADWRDMLDKARLDGVVVCTPHDSHVEPTLAALDHGLQVLLEKPSAHTTADAWKIAHAAERSKQILTIGEDVRGMRSWRAVKHAIDSGAIGGLRQLSAVCCIDWQRLNDGRPVEVNLRQWLESADPLAMVARGLWGPDAWRFDSARMGGDMLMDVGIHLVDLMLWLGGAEPTQVVAFRSPDSDSTVFILQAQLANGVLLSISFNDSVAGEAFGFYGQGQLTAVGTRALIKTSWSGPMKAEAEFARLEGPSGNSDISFDPFGASVAPASAFVATLLDGAPNLCTAREGAIAVSVVQSAYESAGSNRIVALL